MTGPQIGERVGAGMAEAVLLGKARLENFPVASRLLPAVYRRHLTALYGYARLVDDLGDEAPGDRLALLDAVEADLDRLFAGGAPTIPLLRRLAPTVRECGLPPEPFRRLIEANRIDQQVSRYARFADLLGYCELSANPVGHLVLGVFGLATADRLALSDAICTGLQLAEHWQDVTEDARRGRVYLPQQDLALFGCTEAELTAGHASVPLRRLLAHEVGRAGDLLDRGAPLVGTLSGFPRLAVAGYVAGGRAALAAIAARDYDVMPGAPRPTRRRLVGELVAALLRRR